MKDIKILFIEDDISSAEIVCDFFETLNYSVTYCDTLTTGISYLNTESFDILLLDLNLPDAFGLDIYEKVSYNHRPSIIVISAYSQIETKLKAFNLGVDDYICKPYNLEELNARIKNIIAKKERPSLNKGKPIFLVEENIINFKDKLLDLTKMEYKILKVLIENKNTIILRDELLDMFELSNSSRSIDYHIKNIRIKIEDSKKKPTYLFTEYGVGYKLKF